MKTIILTLTLIASSALAAGEQCSRYCNPEVSKPCGNACISKAFTCRKSWTTACVGINPRSNGKRGYENPKKVTLEDAQKLIQGGK